MLKKFTGDKQKLGKAEQFFMEVNINECNALNDVNVDYEHSTITEQTRVLCVQT
jgi:hypothetical protein